MGPDRSHPLSMGPAHPEIIADVPRRWRPVSEPVSIEDVTCNPTALLKPGGCAEPERGTYTCVPTTASVSVLAVCMKYHTYSVMKGASS